MSTTTSPVAGKIGRALKFNGSSYVSISSSPAYTSVQSKSAWVYIQGAVSGNQYIIDEGGNDNWMQIYLGHVRAGESGGCYVDSNATVVTNKWYDIVTTHDNATLKIYINGILDNSVSCGAVIPAAITVGSYSSDRNEMFNGIIDDVRIYNRALSAQEVQQLYLLMGK